MTTKEEWERALKEAFPLPGEIEEPDYAQLHARALVRLAEERENVEALKRTLEEIDADRLRVKAILAEARSIVGAWSEDDDPFSIYQRLGTMLGQPWAEGEPVDWSTS